MGRYRKKPVEIDAAQWDGTVGGATSIIDWILAEGGTARFHSSNPEAGIDRYIAVDTLEGTYRASPADWIIRGVQGELYPCKPDIFEATYEPVAE
jgi:hypothetical protein